MFIFELFVLGYIKQTEQNSGVTFPEAQVALSRQWVAGDQLTTQKEIILSVPAGGESLVPAGKETNTIKVPIPTDDNAAREVVEKFENAARAIRSDADVSDSVSQHMLADKTSLFDEKWLGSEQEELDSYVALPI